jgi:hypothetical protein
VFTGLHDIDWAAMRHAYGPAFDVPDLLRGLASDDPHEREIALDGMYGAVHHQGDVYDSTLACIPFLFELLVDPSVQDRGAIVGLLASIGGIDIDDGDADGRAVCEDERTVCQSADEPDEEEAAWAANYAMAHTAVRASADVFLDLLSDPDPDVRREIPLMLTAWRDKAETIFEVLCERLPHEPDSEARLALVEAVGTLAVREPELTRIVGGWLTGLAGLVPAAETETGPASRPDDIGPALGLAAGDPALRLAALAQLARCAPEALPADLVPVVRGLLAEVHEAAGPAPAAGRTAASASPPGVDGTPRPASPTLLGHLRELRAQEEAGRIAPCVADLLHTLHGALGDRVADRTALLTDQLRGRDWGCRIDAVRMAGGLMRGRRGEYGELVALVGDQLADAEPRLVDAAATLLENLFGLAAPAADALAECLRSAPRTADRAARAEGPPPWVVCWSPGGSGLGPVPKALARLGDPRALPALTWVLEQPDIPSDIGQAVAALGAPGTVLVPLLRRRLGQARLDDGLYDRADPLLTALAALAQHGDASAAAVPEVLRVLRGAPDRHREWTLMAASRALGSIGPAAREAVPELRAQLAGGTRCPDTALAAAAALWRIAPDPEATAAAVLPLLQAQLASNAVTSRTAVEIITELGPAAAPAAPRLRGLLTAPEIWMRLDAAVALWTVVGDPEPVLPVLRASWHENPHTRPTVAHCARLMGPAAAPLAPFLRRELAAVRRHNHSEHHYGSHDISADENLLETCREALFRM